MTLAAYPSSLFLTVGSLRTHNTYQLTGRLEGRAVRMDNLVIQHVDTQRALRQLPRRDRVLVRLLVEGYSLRDIATALTCSLSTVWRRLQQIKWTLYGLSSLPGGCIWN